MLRNTLNKIKKLNNEIHTYSLNWLDKQPTVNYVIFAQGRTGSKLLCNLLQSHPEIFADYEILSYPKLFPISYVKAKSRLASNRQVYGFKVKIYQLVNEQNLDPKYFLAELIEDGWKLIYLKRNNYFRHAISNQVAQQRKQFHIYENERVSKSKRLIEIDCDVLLSSMKRRQKWQQEEASVLADFEYEEVVYEKDLLISENHQVTTNRLFKFLGLDPYPVSSSINRSTESSLTSFIVNPSEVYEAVLDSQYSYFLEQELDFK